MELSRLVGLIQYEIQKSYDFIEQIAKGGTGTEASVLHVSLERVELDLPVSLSEEELTFNRLELNMPLFGKSFLMPYAPDKLAQLPKGIPRKEFIGSILDVELLNLKDKLDEAIPTEQIGRIKIVLKPILK